MHKKLFAFFLFGIFIMTCHVSTAKDIESYIQEASCNDMDTNLCTCVKNLHKALTALASIQSHNFKLIQQRIKKQTQENMNIHIKEAKDMQKNDIVIMTFQAYHTLNNSMKKFCKDFQNLSNKEQKILFTLEWNKRALFQNHNDVMRFCKTQY